MKTFNEFTSTREDLEEGLVRKGAVSAYALQGKRHGDAAVKSLQSAKLELQGIQADKKADETSKRLASALISLADGLIALRQQIGSVSSQITSHSIIEKGGK